MAALEADHVHTAEESGRLYRLIADTIPHMVWTAGADGALDYFNRRCYEYTGLDSLQLAGWAWKSVIHADDWEHCLAVWTRSLQSGERYEIEYRLRRKDGVYRWHHGSAIPLRDRDGRVTRWFGTCTDVEEQFRSAQMLEALAQERGLALRDAERRLRDIFENEPECVKLLDEEGRLLEMNAAGLRMIEADSIVPVLGQCVYPLIAEAHRQAFRELTEKVCRGERGTLQFEMVGLKGSHCWLETHAVPFDDRATGRTRLLGITRNITERRQAEEKARVYSERIRDMVVRLIQAQELERRRLADDLHDLIGQNLTALGVQVAALKSVLGPPQDAGAVPRLEAIEGLLNDTVDLIRGVMTELRPPALEEYGLLPALRWYADAFSQRTGIRVTTNALQADVRLARDTEIALFRIVQEALANAAKHSGGSCVEISVTQHGERLRVMVEDDGRGFADPVGARSAARGGWGLPTMRERAEAQGGTLRIEFPPRGTRLIVEVPAHSAH